VEKFRDINSNVDDNYFALEEQWVWTEKNARQMATSYK
jgi:hypothetical protein